MKPLLRALIVEDSEDDTRLLLREIERSDYEIVHERVETAEALSAALDRESWDILFCDYTLPRFSGEAALEIVKERDLELPFIFVSGTLGEDVAVRAMKAGAHDYVMKDNLTRLVPAMERELGEANVRRQHRQAEKAMRISEYKYRHLFESLSDAAFLIDTEAGQIIDTNPQGEALLGRPRTEILGMRENQLYPPRRDQAQPPALLTSGAREQRRELNVLRKNGGIVPVHVSVSKMELHDRHVLLALFHDITERKGLEQAQAWLGAIVDGSQDAIIGTTPEGTITSWNQGARRIFGYTPDEIIGKSVWLLIPSERLQEEEKIFARIQRGEREEHYEAVRRHKDGRLIDVSLTVSPILDGSGQFIGISKIAQNVTKQKLLEAQLRQSQKMEAVGQLAGGVAHDFNNMLSVIFGQCELLEKALPTDNALNGSVAEILRASERAAALTRQLLAFSRRQVLIPKVVDLNAIVTEAETLLRRIIGEDVQLGTVLRADLHSVRVDPVQIDQVILNLAVNARDAMPHGGAFTMETSEIELESTDGKSPRAVTSY